MRVTQNLKVVFSKVKAEGRQNEEEEDNEAGPTRSWNTGFVPDDDDIVRGYIIGDLLGGVAHWAGLSNKENALVSFLSSDELFILSENCLLGKKTFEQDKHKKISLGLFSFNAKSDTALTNLIQISDGVEDDVASFSRH